MTLGQTAETRPVALHRREPGVWMRGVSQYSDSSDFGWLLTRVSFEVRRGEVFGLLGPAGSGKSTILRILAGRLSPSEGRARVFDRSPRRRSAKARVGYVPSQPDACLGLLAKALARLGELFLVRTPGSKVASRVGGDGRRALLKEALLKNPNLLLLDEPFAGLDEAGCVELKDLIAGLARRGKTVVLSSSSLCHARDVCDRLALLYRGHIEAIGPLGDLLAAPQALRHLGDLLPKPTAERALQVIREDLGAPSLPGKAALSIAPGSGTPALPQAGKPSAAAAVLDPLLKAPVPACRPELEPTRTVNHHLLAALASLPPGTAPPQPEPKPAFSRHNLPA